MGSRKVIFVGGAHGVGKTTLCSVWAQIFGCEHIKASSLLHLPQSRMCVTGEPTENQKAIAANVTRLTSMGDSPILLDGHYCLVRAGDDVYKVEDEFFRSISPQALVLVEATADVVIERLHLRDGTVHPHALVKKLLEAEANWAEQVALTLKLPLVRYNGHEDIDQRKGLQSLLNNIKSKT